MPTSRSYQEYLIQSLKDPAEAAAYIQAILEKKDPEPELLPLALRNVAEALGEQNMTSEQAKLHLEKLDQFLSQQGSDVIYSLANWLNALGLKLTVTVSEQAKYQSKISTNNSELTV